PHDNCSMSATIHFETHDFRINRLKALAKREPQYSDAGHTPDPPPQTQRDTHIMYAGRTNQTVELYLVKKHRQYNPSSIFVKSFVARQARRPNETEQCTR